MEICSQMHVMSAILNFWNSSMSEVKRCLFVKEALWLAQRIVLTNEKLRNIGGSECRSMLAHQDRAGLGWLTKPAENPWSETTQTPPAC